MLQPWNGGAVRGANGYFKITQAIVQRTDQRKARDTGANLDYDPPPYDTASNRSSWRECEDSMTASRESTHNGFTLHVHVCVLQMESTNLFTFHYVCIYIQIFKVQCKKKPTCTQKYILLKIYFQCINLCSQINSFWDTRLRFRMSLLSLII